MQLVVGFLLHCRNAYFLATLTISLILICVFSTFCLFSLNLILSLGGDGGSRSFSWLNLRQHPLVIRILLCYRCYTGVNNIIEICPLLDILGVVLVCQIFFSKLYFDALLQDTLTWYIQWRVIYVSGRSATLAFRLVSEHFSNLALIFVCLFGFFNYPFYLFLPSQTMYHKFPYWRPVLPCIIWICWLLPIDC